MKQSNGHPTTKTLFPPWKLESWRRVDDSVRGGASISNLVEISVDSYDLVVFQGHLDTTVLGGAGFASQKFSFSPPLHLHGSGAHAGLKLSVLSKNRPEDVPSRFVITLKTEPPPPPSQPKPRSQLTYEATFAAPSAKNESSKFTSVFLPYDSFVPTFRGRAVPRDSPRWKPLDPSRVYELGIMCRSEFGKQQGDFDLSIERIEAVKCCKTPWSRIMAAIGRLEDKLWTALACTTAKDLDHTRY